MFFLLRDSGLSLPTRFVYTRLLALAFYREAASFPTVLQSFVVAQILSNPILVDKSNMSLNMRKWKKWSHSVRKQKPVWFFLWLNGWCCCQTGNYSEINKKDTRSLLLTDPGCRTDATVSSIPSARVRYSCSNRVFDWHIYILNKNPIILRWC